MKKSVWMVAVAAVAAMTASRGAFGEGRDGFPCGFEDEVVYECGTPYVNGDWEEPVKSPEEIRRDHKAAAMAAVEAVVRERKIELIRAREAAKEEAARAAKSEKQGLVLHYAFGRGGVWGSGAVVKDLSGGGHDGRVEGDGLEVVRGIGKRGKAVRFDGKGDYIRVPRDASLEAEELTLAVWLKLRKGAASLADEGIGTVVFKRNTSFHDNEDYCLEIHPGRLLRTDISSPRGGHDKVTTGKALEPEAWHHVAVTVGGGRARIYVDGELAAEKTPVQAFDHSQQTDLLVGVRDHAGYPLNRFGMFDLFELKMWDKALDAKQVAALYRARAGKIGVAEKKKEKGTQGLVLHYAFGRGGKWGTGAVVKDLSGGGHDGRVEGDGLEVVPGMGRQGAALRFEGKREGDYIRVPKDVMAGTKALTAAAWLRVREEDEEGASGTIVFKRNTSQHENEGICFEILSDFRLKVTVANRESRGQCQVFASVAMSKGVWHHAALTYERGRACIYLDGALVGSGNAPESLDFNPAADWLVGTRDHAEYPLGRFGVFELADFKLWNETLEAEKIAQLWREGNRKGAAEGQGTGKCVRTVEPNQPPRRCGGRVPVPPRRVFPEWKPEGKDAKGGDSRLAAELSALVAQGRRDRAASPEFLTALERLAKRYADAAEKKPAPSDRLPMRADWQGAEWPAGWESVRRDVWTFGDGKARQNEARPDTRYVLFYEPGMKWRDYAVKVRFESDAWFVPPSRSAAEVWVRCKGVDEAYRVEWCGAGDMAVIIREGAGKERTLARASVPVDVVRDGKPWTVRVRGSQITVEHEGRFYLEVNDPTYREGSVGVESIHIPVSFDALEVEAL